jgi:hypothetical protein
VRRGMQGERGGDCCGLEAVRVGAGSPSRSKGCLLYPRATQRPREVEARSTCDVDAAAASTARLPNRRQSSPCRLVPPAHVRNGPSVPHASTSVDGAEPI